MHDLLLAHGAGQVSESQSKSRVAIYQYWRNVAAMVALSVLVIEKAESQGGSNPLVGFG